MRITDTLLAGLDYISSSPAGIYDGGNGTIVWEIGDLPVNDAHTLTVTAQVKPDMRPAL